MFSLLALTGCSTSDDGEYVISELAAEFATILNNHRTLVGCPQLTLSVRLSKVAQGHSDDMENQDFFAHTNPNNSSTASSRVTGADVAWTAVGENIARGQSTALQVFTDWFNSPGHRANMEQCIYTHHGVAINTVRNTWTNVFVRSSTLTD